MFLSALQAFFALDDCRRPTRLGQAAKNIVKGQLWLPRRRWGWCGKCGLTAIRFPARQSVSGFRRPVNKLNTLSAG